MSDDDLDFRVALEARLGDIEGAAELHSETTTLQHKAIFEKLEHLDGCVDKLKRTVKYALYGLPTVLIGYFEISEHWLGRGGG